MSRAEVLKQLAENELESAKDQIEEEEDEENIEEEVEEEEQKVIQNLPSIKTENFDTQDLFRRFECDICEKRFGKKFNLDRHNRAIHNRQTPYIAPLVRAQNQKPVSEIKSEEIVVKAEIMEEEVIKEEFSPQSSSPSPSPKKNPSQLKINLFGKL